MVLDGTIGAGITGAGITGVGTTGAGTTTGVSIMDLAGITGDGTTTLILMVTTDGTIPITDTTIIITTETIITEPEETTLTIQAAEDPLQQIQATATALIPQREITLQPDVIQKVAELPYLQIPEHTATLTVHKQAEEAIHHTKTITHNKTELIPEVKAIALQDLTAALLRRRLHLHTAPEDLTEEAAAVVVAVAEATDHQEEAEDK